MKISLPKIVLPFILVLSCTKKPMNNDPVAFLVSQSNEQLKAEFFHAITQNNCEKVKRILRSVPEEEVKELLIDATDKNGNTPLHVTAEKGQKEVANLLLEKGAEVNATDNDAWTPLHV
ncbi:MAG: ankyrin repeat domain-containing protein, partial [Cytophagales bacterium]|nr:ankyrin repeat domain-containing protein [Cytophagales bacterium]